MLTMVCDDALVPFPTIDPRKFVEIYIKRRKAEINGQPYTGPVESINATPKDEDGGWTPVGMKAPAKEANLVGQTSKVKPAAAAIKPKKKGKK